MNQNETRTLWISVGAALFAVFLLYSYTQEKSAELTKKFGAKERVVIATRDINEMETIDETMLEIIEQPVDFIQPKALSNPEDAVGLVALAPIKTGEQLLESKIMQPGPVTGLSLQVAPGKRAFALPIDEVRGIAKLIKPGDRVDILAALDVGQGRDQKREIKTLMQDVIVLATGLRVTNELPRLYEKEGRDEYIKNMRGSTDFSTITIEASPREVQELAYIMSLNPGALYYSLRHPTDRATRSLQKVGLDDVLGKVAKPIIQQQTRIPAQAPPPKPKPKPRPKTPFRDI